MLFQLQEIGIPLRLSNKKDFEELFESYRHLGDKDISLGYYWFQRGSRNLSFDHTYTIAQLKDLEVEFTPFDQCLLKKMFDSLLDSGVLLLQLLLFSFSSFKKLLPGVFLVLFL